MLLPARKAVVAESCDVLVVGGGPAGIGAALGAAKLGAQVVLAERYGFLGGSATAALVMPLMSIFTQHPKKQHAGDISMFPTDHGWGEPVIAGAVRELIERLVKAGGALPPTYKTGYVVPFDHEVFKFVAMEMVDEAGVHVLYHSFASECIMRKKEPGVVFETKSGPVVINAKMIVDCTGDGDVATSAGGHYDVGRDTDGLVQPMTLYFRLTNFEKVAFENYARMHPDQWKGVHGLWDLVKQAALDGELDLPREDILLFGSPHPGEVSVNSTRVIRVLGTDIWDITYAEWESRRQMKHLEEFFKRYVPGFNKSYVIQSGIQIGIRETRRIKGDYCLNAQDVMEARRFDDVIARCIYPIDIHNPTGRGTVIKRVSPGEAYDIPLRCCIPKDLDNILVAGRCISGTHEAHSSYRVMPVSMSTGQGAGVCAALAARANVHSRDVAIEDVQRELKKQGADLG
ncbi:FAD-dependent oxidoreductase [Chitinispirillales bacterium ANBcel5]|uniref:FAD-dependent oxidoreductase n=1 Tax=Cellulosispirillum alkaliphilum TaxID=3039283 RepID=UPI002A57A4B2|nr:FAD-dependent oxidoreductase [Chitinispirillales bacterium ANBcel5]